MLVRREFVYSKISKTPSHVQLLSRLDNLPADKTDSAPDHSCTHAIYNREADVANMYSEVSALHSVIKQIEELVAQQDLSFEQIARLKNCQQSC